MAYVAVFARSMLALVFLWSATSKVRGRNAFGEFVGSVRRLGAPAGLARPAAVAVIVVEFAVPPALAAEVTALPGLAVAAGLLGVLTVALGHALHRGRTAPCRCFGASTAPPGPEHIAGNLLLGAVAIAGAAGALGGGSGPDAAGLVIAAVSGGVCGVLVVSLDDLLALFRGPPAPKAGVPTAETNSRR